METRYSEEEKLARAKKRVEQIKGFYRHLVVYLLVNIFLILASAGLLSGGLVNGLDFELRDFSTAFLWGIGLLLHGLFVFRFQRGFFKTWEERKIREFMEKEQRESEKFNDKHYE